MVTESRVRDPRYLRGLVLASVASCWTGCGAEDALYFTFDDRRVLCAASLDDYKKSLNWERLQQRLENARTNNWVLGLYTHSPGENIRVETLERVFQMIEQADLPFVTYADLDPEDTPYGGVTVGFDDASVETWFASRALFDKYNAKVTFFLTRYATYSPEQRAMIHTLAEEGHAIEAHGVQHRDVVKYAEEHGIDAMLRDEVLPSLEVLAADGFTPRTFAYPFGAHSAEIDEAILAHVPYVRTTAGPCPN